MQTKVFRISPTNPDPKIIKVAAEIIKNGGLVAFPTETVYGLGASALDSNTTEKIFKAKNRPADNPIIVHIGGKEELKKIAKDIPKAAWKLAEVFWPGPLTFVLKKTENVPLVISGGLDTVAVRMPNHAVALELIKQAGVPIAAPSANTATRPSPTTAQHVYDDLVGKIDCILDAGEVSIGIESTVLDLSSETPSILRPGAITAEMLSRYIPNISNIPTNPNSQTRSPGTKYKHYAPNCEVILFIGEGAREKMTNTYVILSERSESKDPLTIEQEILRSAQNDKDVKCWVIVQKELENIPAADQRILLTAQDYARNIFSIFREAEKKGIDAILVQGLQEEDMGIAVMNRLRKAATRVY